MTSAGCSRCSELLEAIQQLQDGATELDRLRGIAFEMEAESYREIQRRASIISELKRDIAQLRREVETYRRLVRRQLGSASLRRADRRAGRGAK